ncbi:MAG: L,D-transpeptidase [Synergistaceae bacterium]|jgi:lipoprotein-anchoring transpeptidase ErfK/SrfK|nr:L,D-transpeptidase [Synergistaceae bacterium]
MRKKLMTIAAVLVIVVLLCVFIVVSIRYSRRTEPPVPPEEIETVPISGDISSVDVPPAVVPEITESVSSADVSGDTHTLPRSRLAEDKDGTFIVIDKSDFTMEIFRDGHTVGQYGIAVGKNTGDKQRVGDMRTPEGEFPIVQIQNASKWTRDFKDGKGPTRGAYGPYFIRLGTPGWTGIGIHGTHAPDSIGTNVTEGCIRLSNENVQALRKMVKVGDRVVIRR